MSNRVATVLSIVVGMLLTAGCLAFAAYEFCTPQWQVALKYEHKGWDFGKVAGIHSDVKGMPAFEELKGEWKGVFPKALNSTDADKSSEKLGKGGPGQLVLFRYVDKSSPQLAQLCAQGGQVGDLTVQASKLPNKDSTSSMGYSLHGVTISSITLRGPNAPGRLKSGAVPIGQPVEEIALSYRTIEWTWRNGPATELKMQPGALKIQPAM